ncbi:nucleotide-diphospho-sugar transferase [Scenedesmus sp. NREL 46B-D3]|nr:nucleotide-diphospho-sugar transferase [Scenedesmus sp. NREL 46B-D3]
MTPPAASRLCRVEAFYDSMGGLPGYQLKSLQLILGGNSSAQDQQQQQQQAHQQQNQQAAASRDASSHQQQQQQQQQQQPEGLEDSKARVTYHVPPGLDLAGEAGSLLGVRAAAQGLLAMPYLSEILPVGGAGDRLGLRCEASGEGLPAAMLPYCGRSMMEGLIRDLQAKEYLYWQLTGTQVTTPVAIMTSDAKGNHDRIRGLMDSHGWFGRSPDSFRLFRQPMVPVIDAADGRWLVTAPGKVMMKPGGHGAIWKLMHDQGVFDWLQQQGRLASLIRQVSNPMAGCDTTLLALAGSGFSARRAFGFMSCERVVGAAEGMNVLQERKVWVEDSSLPEGGSWQYDYAITNVEYTEFERLGITDQPMHEGSNHSAFPANTNILYVGLAAARAAVEAAVAAGGGEVMPGLIFNLKKKVKFFDPFIQDEREVRAGRMECTMQNLADSLTSRSAAALAGPGAGPGAEQALMDRLSTFMVYNMRRKVTSSAKKKRDPRSSHIHQTPEGAFYDLQRNAWQVLQRCGMRHVPPVGGVQEYLAQGPGFLCLFHPALGPLWDVIAQKVRGGALLDGSELVLEVAEARLLDVTVDGSLLVHADNIMGHMEQQQQQQGAERGAGDDGGGSSGRLQYSAANGRVHLMNVTVRNVGVDWHHPGNVYWQHRVNRHEACRVLLHGRSEFEAYDCTISGNQVFEVPDGFRMVVTASGSAGGLSVQLLPLRGDKPTWQWSYAMEPSGALRLQFVRNAALDLWSSPVLAAARSRQQNEEEVLDFVI